MEYKQNSASAWIAEMLGWENLEGLKVLIVGSMPEQDPWQFSDAGASVTKWMEDAVPLENPWNIPDHTRFDLACFFGVFDKIYNCDPLLRYLPYLAGAVIIDPAPDDQQIVAKLIAQGEFEVNCLPVTWTSHGNGLFARESYSNGRVRTPLFLHVHIPKCAGISFNRLLEERFVHSHLNIYPDGLWFSFTPDQLGRVVHDNPGLMSIASHGLRQYPPVIAGRPALYTCFLRDPVEQFLSYVTYVKKNYRSLRPIHKTVLPPDADQMSVRDLATWIIEAKEEDVPFRDNYCIRFLTRHVIPAQIRGTLIRNGMDLTGKLHPELNLELALKILDQFLLVGICELMDESLRLLRHKLLPYGIDLHRQLKMPYENISREYRDDIDWLNENDLLGKRVLKSLEIDRKLYEIMRSRFVAQLAEIEIAKKISV